MSKLYFNLTPDDNSRLFFGEVFAIACAMHVNPNCYVYFKYENAMTQKQVGNFFGNIFSSRILLKTPSDKEFALVAKKHAHALALSKMDSISVFDFSKEFIKNFPFKYRKAIHKLLRKELANTLLRHPGKNKAAFLCIRNSQLETEKNITESFFRKACNALAKHDIRTIVVIGDKLPDNIALNNADYQRPLLNFTNYGQMIKDKAGVPEEMLLQAQVYFLKVLKDKYYVRVGVGCPSGGAHMLGSLGIPIVFANLSGTRFLDIQFSNNSKSTFFPFTGQPSHHTQDEDESFEAQLSSALQHPSVNRY